MSELTYRSSDLYPNQYALSVAVPKRLIEKPPPGRYGSYVPHFVISQILLATVGPYDFAVDQILYGEAPLVKGKDQEWGPFENVIVGAVCTLGVKIDHVAVEVQEVGSIHQPAKEPSDGDRLKKVTSDALKRCAMRLGLGVHLWCKREDQFFLPNLMLAAANEDAPEAEDAVVGGQDEDLVDGEVEG